MHEIAGTEMLKKTILHLLDDFQEKTLEAMGKGELTGSRFDGMAVELRRQVQGCFTIAKKEKDA